jgi:ribose-phosphate pyrophosphokinase
MSAPILVTCTASSQFREGLKRHFSRDTRFAEDGVEFHDDIDWYFPDGEACCRLDVNIEGRDVYVLQSLISTEGNCKVNDNLMTALSVGRLMKGAGAASVNAIFPVLAYARQDKPTPGHVEPVTARLVAELLKLAGFTSILTLHASNGAKSVYGGVLPMRDASPLPFMSSVLQTLDIQQESAALISPDIGAKDLVEDLSDQLGLRAFFGSKVRHGPSDVTVELQAIPEDVSTVVLVDDLIASGVTLLQAVRQLTATGEINRVVLLATHLQEGRKTKETLLLINEIAPRLSVHVTNTIAVSPDISSLPFLTRHDATQWIARELEVVNV